MLRWVARSCLLCAALVALAGCRTGPRDERSGVVSCDESRDQVCWPRFPPAADSRQLPRLAVFLSAGEINQNTTLARLGYPDRLLFRLHQDLPRLRVVLLGSPANRYSGERDVTQSPEGAATWKALATEPRFSWLEIGGQGYTHSPPGDTNLNHHEFDAGATGCNLDHARMATPEYCRERLGLARAAYDHLGLPRNTVVMIRFPGLSDSPAALAAATDAGFLAMLGNKHSEDAGRPQWLAHPSGEILDLENTKITELAASARSAGGEPDPGAVMKRVQKAIDQGGVLNLRADLQDLFDEVGAGTPAYGLLTRLLQRVEEKHGPAVWYPRGRDLALWLDLARHARVAVSARADAIELSIEPPESWSAAGHGFDEAAIAVRVPADWEDVTEVSVGQAPVTRWFWAGPRLVVVPFGVRGPVRVRVAGS